MAACDANKTNFLPLVCHMNQQLTIVVNLHFYRSNIQGFLSQPHVHFIVTRDFLYFTN